MTKACVDCGGTSPDVRFSRQHTKCNVCRARNSRVTRAEYQRRRTANQTDADRKAHAARVRRDRVENPHLTFYSTSRYLAKKAGVYSDLTKEGALSIYETPNVCGYCGKDVDPNVKRALHIDHIVPMSQGGVNSRWNLVKACVSCNSSKDRHSLIDFYGRTAEFTPERYEAVVNEMVRLSGRSRTEIDELLTLSHAFEIAHERERQRMLGALNVFTV